MSPFPEIDTRAAATALDCAFTSPMQEFLEAATKLAKLDETVSQLRADAPAADGNQACMWFEVSMRSMMVTRNLFVKQQAEAMKKLQVAAAAQRGDALEEDTADSSANEEADQASWQQASNSISQAVQRAVTAPREQPEPEVTGVLAACAEPEEEPEDEEA